MNLSEQEIESLLRRAPRPRSLAGLKTQLIAQMRLPRAQSETQRALTSRVTGGWFRRWWPALVPATVSLVCAVVLAVQQMEIRNLKQTVHLLSQAAPTETASPATVPTADNIAPALDPAARDQQEISRLKELVRQLTGELARLEKIQTENASLREQLATSPGLTAEELDALAKARERALEIRCINNMKQLGLAARQWAIDNNDVFPTDILSMTNEMNTPKILVCPAETNRLAAASWSDYTAANCSYEFLAPGGNETEPTRVLFRCPFHGTIGLCDGSVQKGVAKTHPERLVQRDGKLYYENNP